MKNMKLVFYPHLLHTQRAFTYTIIPPLLLFILMESVVIALVLALWCHFWVSLGCRYRNSDQGSKCGEKTKTKHM